MSSYYLNPSETQDLLEENVETGQERLERQRTSKCLLIAVIAFGVGLIIGINFSSTILGKYDDI